MQPNASVLLLIEIPRTNDKKELAAQSMFASLHGILKPNIERWGKTIIQDHLSFEIASIDKRIRFYVWTPRDLQIYIEGQIYAQYPTAQISELSEDYAARQMPQPVVHSTEIVLTDNDVLPIKTFPSFEVDPLAGITATLAKLDDEDEEMWIQVLVRPIKDDWHKKGSKAISKIKAGGVFDGFGGYAAQVLAAPFKAPEETSSPKEKVISERDRTRIAAIEEKTTKLGYQVKIRILYIGNNESVARLRMQAIVGTFKQYNTTNLNGFTSDNTSFDKQALSQYQERHFRNDGFILNIEELASLYHLPHTSVETPNIVWASSKTAEPPSNLPAQGRHAEEDLCLYGVSNFRGSNRVFGALRRDRDRHIYILGQTGTGKSGLLELFALSDVFYNKGYAIIDPHGDFAINNMKYIPESRINDVVYFNPADGAFPIGFNPLEVTDPTQKGQISSELVGVMKRMFDSWGPRLEYILRYTLLALLDYPDSTMLDITRMLTDKRFRKDVINHIEDMVVKTFWVTEFASWNEKFASEAVAPVLNKVGAFTANPLIRNIIGQPHGSFNIRELMDQRKILIMNLSRGLIGEDNAAILGAMMVTKIQLAAMSRADIPNVEDRVPFYLYVDEFQNFATDSFAVILSEARKYALNLTVANQYISQMNEVVRSAVFGNVGTIVSFRVSPEDAPFLQKYFEPQFEATDLIQLANRSFVTSMTIAGEKSPAFSGRTLMIPAVQTNHSQAIIANSRERYAKTREEVEKLIEDSAIRKSGDSQQDNQQPQPNQPNQQAAQPVQNNAKPAQPEHKPNKQATNTHKPVALDDTSRTLPGMVMKLATKLVHDDAKPAKTSAEQPKDANKGQKQASGQSESNDKVPIMDQGTEGEQPTKPKRRRRSRSRRKKNPANTDRTNTEQNQQAQTDVKKTQNNSNNEVVIDLR